MSGFQYFVNVWKNHYVDFDGRARRSEYWYFVLFNALIAWGLILILGMISPRLSMIAYGIYIIASILPSLGVAVRRLHDTDRQGVWLLIGLIPLVGGIVLLVFMVEDSKVGANKWGPNPKGSAADVLDDLSDHLVP